MTAGRPHSVIHKPNYCLQWSIACQSHLRHELDAYHMTVHIYTLLQGSHDTVGVLHIP